MKKLLLISVLTTGLFAAVPVKAMYIDKAMERSLIEICEAIRSNQRMALDRAIGRSGLNLKRVMKGLECNGHNPVSFARLYQADKTGKFLAARLDVDYHGRLAKN